MSDQQLTVAELMARAAKEGGRSADSGRRRRRRSLEDGGVSVAELTGSIPKVTAKPVEARHTAVPIDAPADEKPVAEQPEAPKLPETLKKPETPKQADVPVSVVGADEPVRLTTDSFPAQLSQETKDRPADAKPADAKRDVAKPAAPVEAGGTAVAATAAKKTQDAEETATIPVVRDEIPTPAQVAKVESTDSAELESEEDNSVSMGSVIAMALLGIVVGIGLFIGFKVLWASLSAVVVAVLAIVMTLGIVGVVHALRTEKDGMSMGLAAIAGLAMTFGPYLVANL